MRIEQLSYFVEVTRSKSITLTSERLHISQQTLSGSIKNLEDELGVALLNRHYNGTTLTKEGEAFLATATQMLALLETFKTDYVATTSKLRGTIHVYATPVLSSTILSNVLFKFYEAHPLTKFQTYENDLRTVYRLFEQGGLPPNSIALINSPDESRLEKEKRKWSPPTNTQFSPLSNEHFVACVHPQSPVAHKNTISIKMLMQQPLVLYLTDNLEDSTLYYLLQQYGTPNIALTTGNVYVYLQAVNDNIGIGLLPNLSLKNPLIKNNIKTLHILQVKNNPLHSIIGYLLPLNAAPDPLMDAFIAFLKIYTV